MRGAAKSAHLAFEARFPSRGVAIFRSADQPLTAPKVGEAFFFKPAPAPARPHAVDGRSPMDARVLSVLEAVASELEKPQLVRDMAARLHLSPSRFEHIFKNETGEGFKAFLRAARMSRAKDMLQDPTLRVKEVAAAVGYADVSNFSHDFRKHYGRSPSQSRSPSPEQV